MTKSGITSAASAVSAVSAGSGNHIIADSNKSSAPSPPARNQHVRWDSPIYSEFGTDLNPASSTISRNSLSPDPEGEKTSSEVYDKSHNKDDDKANSRESLLDMLKDEDDDDEERAQEGFDDLDIPFSSKSDAGVDDVDVDKISDQRSSFLSMIWENGRVSMSASGEKEDDEEQEGADEDRTEDQNQENADDGLPAEDNGEEEDGESVDQGTENFPTRASRTRREKIEKLRSERKKSHHAVSNLLQNGRAQSLSGPKLSKAPEPPRTEEEDDVQDEQSIEVAIVEKSSSKSKKSKEKKASSKKKSKTTQSSKGKEKKSKNASKDKKGRQQKKKRSKGKKQSMLTITWQRVKSSLQPWKKRDVSLFSPSSSEEDETDREHKKRQEEIVRTIQKEAAQNMGRGTRSSPDKNKKSSKAARGKKARKANDHGGNGSDTQQYDGDADTNSEHEASAPKSRWDNDVPTAMDAILENGSNTDSENEDEAVDMEVHQHTSAAMKAAIAIVISSRSQASALAPFVDGEPQILDEQTIVEKKSSESSAGTNECGNDDDDDDVEDDNKGDLYFSEKGDKSMVSQVSPTQSQYSIVSNSSYSSDGEDTDSEDEEDNEDEERSDCGSRDSPTPHHKEHSSSPSGEEPHSLVPHKSGVIFDPYAKTEDSTDAPAKQDFMWLYGKDVKLPIFLRACIFCPTGACCDVWAHSNMAPEGDPSASSKKKMGACSMTDSCTATASNSTMNSPIACWSPSAECVADSPVSKGCTSLKFGEKESPFCNIPEEVYNDSLFYPSRSKKSDNATVDSDPNPAESDTENGTLHPPAIGSTVDLIYHSCGIALQAQQQSFENLSHCSSVSPTMCFADKGFSEHLPAMPVSCGTSKIENVVTDQCGVLEAAVANWVAPPPRASLPGKPADPLNHKKPKKSPEDPSSKKSKKKRKTKVKFSDDKKVGGSDLPLEATRPLAEPPKETTAPEVEIYEASVPPKSSKDMEFEGILQATEDAIAMLSLPYTRDVTNVSSQNEAEALSAKQEDMSQGDAHASDHASKISAAECSHSLSNSGRNDVSQSSVDSRHTGGKSTDASHTSTVFTPEDQSMVDELMLDYSGSNMDAWSVDAEVNEKKPASDEPKQKLRLAKSDEAAGKLPKRRKTKAGKSKAHVSDFVKGIFGKSARRKKQKQKDSPAPGEKKIDKATNHDKALEKPNSLRSLVEDDSGDSGSMSSLSVSLIGAKSNMNKKDDCSLSRASSSLDRKRLEQLVSEMMAHPHGFIFVSRATYSCTCASAVFQVGPNLLNWLFHLTRVRRLKKKNFRTTKTSWIRRWT